jgi:hypothetical protein
MDGDKAGSVVVGPPLTAISSESVIEVEIPDQESESELRLAPTASSKALVRSRKRARPAEITRDSESDFPDQNSL